MIHVGNRGSDVDSTKQRAATERDSTNSAAKSPAVTRPRSGQSRSIKPFATARICAAWMGILVGAYGVVWADEDPLAKLPARIITEGYANQNWDLWTMRPDGSDRQNLTNTPTVHELYPQASPYGRRIAFLVDEQMGRETRRSLWIMDVDGSHRRQIAEGGRDGCWSPDGTRYAFPKQEFARFQIKDFVSKRLYFYDVATGQTAVHPNEAIEHIYNPTWSADGQWIVTTVHGGMGFGHAIVALEVKGNRVIDLKIGGCRPCLSNDGKRLTWSRDDHTVCVADVAYGTDGPSLSGERVLYHDDTMHLYHPDFSPDGRFITFSLGPGGRVAADGPGTHTEVAEMIGVRGPWDIYVSEVDQPAAPRRLTHDPSFSNKESEWIATPAR